MHRSVGLVTRGALALTGVLALIGTAAQPVAAGEDEDKDSAGGKGVVLVGAIYAFNEQSGVLFLTNAGAQPVRAFVTVHDSDDGLVGCNVRTVKSGASEFMYIRPGRADLDGALSVRVHGLSTGGSMLGALKYRNGLSGNLAVVEGATGAMLAQSELIEAGSSAADLQVEMDECLEAGFGDRTESNNSDNPVTTVQPARWGDTSDNDDNDNDDNDNDDGTVKVSTKNGSKKT